MIEQFCEPVYRAWVNSAILSGRLKLPASKIDKFYEVMFQPRGWAWVDPSKDIRAGAESVTLGVTTRSDIAAAQGKNLEDIFEQLAKEKELAAQYGITLGDENEDDTSGNAA
jgi:capsid protein